MGPTTASCPISPRAPAHSNRAVARAPARPYLGAMTDPRSFLYRDSLDPDAALRLTAAALDRADDGELYLQYRRAEAFGFDDGRLKTASYDTHAGFGLRAVSGEMTAFAHANELSAAAIERAAASIAWHKATLSAKGTRSSGSASV
jgi:TldD protein